MAWDVFIPPRAPSLGPSGTITFATKKADFGDNYTQEAADGINSKSEAWDVSWNNVTTAEAKTITDFFDVHLGCIPFLFTVPEETQKQYKCRSYKKSRPVNGICSVSATFAQDFTP